MELIRNLKKGAHETEGEVFFKLFDRYIGLLMEDDNIAFAETCAKELNNLSDELIAQICEACIRYCNSFLEDIGEEPKIFSNPRDVLKLISPSALIVPVNENMASVIHMELNCEWEQEHGMEWVIRDNKVLYVGAFNGEHPYDDYSEKDSWNYA